MSNENSSGLKLPVSVGDEIVISGIAGRFPESNNMNELRDNLMEKKFMITTDDRRWKLEDPRIPKQSGKISNLEKFDAIFFGIHPKQAHAVDPMCRILLEHTYEAIVDAGINPKQLRGTRTGVFVGACHSESENTWLYKAHEDGFDMSGYTRALYANRISYSFGLVGPSYAIDSACSSSFSAFEQAYRSVKDGYCDAAIVGGANLCLEPYITMQFFNLVGINGSNAGLLSLDGRCKTWDQSADGYVRSEAACVVFLQKAKDAKRIYCTVVHSKVNCDGYKEEGINFPSRHMQSVLLKQLYAECGVPPSSVSYIEAHGTGTKAGDPEEIAAIDDALGQYRSRRDPLLIGAVKSNLGHTEPVSGLVSLAKVILAMESNVIPPNLHFKNCNNDLKAILEGRLKVVTELTPWTGEYAGISSFGFGGANVHALLKKHTRDKINKGAPNDDLPRLVVISGRTEDAVDTMLSDLEIKPVDVEQLALLYNIHSYELNGHLYRGYTILPSHGVSKCDKEIHSISGIRKPVWFVFSGMGSQWPGMGEDLLRIPIFAEAIRKCDLVLKPHGIDIFRVITDHNRSVFDNILNCFIGISAVQIGLVDILRSLKIEPDYIIGHSLGELGCAYADGCLTAEQMILSAYFRGLVSVETSFITGSMFAVDLGYKDIQQICPPDIEVACHNSSSSSTISGPADSMKKFVTELKAKNILAKEVPCGNIPYHTSYVASAGPKFLAYLKNVIPDKKLRSSKWVSTSVCMDKWNTESARYSSAEYHTNNLLSSVLFEETSNLISNDAITIEIAPHGLLQAILKLSLPSSVINIALTQRNNKNNLEVLMRAVGKMFNSGLLPQIDKLYPSVQFPVSRGTPMISPMIKWQHKDDWFVSYDHTKEQKLGSGEKVVRLNIKSPDYETLADHVIDGIILLPATCYLKLIWETFASMKRKQYTDLPVVFEDIKLLSPTIIKKDEEIELTLMIQKGTGRFEVIEENTLVATGIIRTPSHSEVGYSKLAFNFKNNEEESMTSRDVYKELRIRGYQYSGQFRSVISSTPTGSKAHIIWHNNWIAFLDNVLHISMLAYDTRELFLPTAIDKVVIDPNLHYKLLKDSESGKEFVAFSNKLHNIMFSGGVEIFGVKGVTMSRRKLDYDPIIEEHKFVPFIDGAHISLREIARFVTNIVTENCMAATIKTIELLDENHEANFSVDNLLSPWIFESLSDMTLIQADVSVFCKKVTFTSDTIPDGISIVDLEKASKDASALIVVGHRLLADDRIDFLNSALLELKPKGFILTRESEPLDIKNAANVKGFHVIFVKQSGKETLVLLKKKEKNGGNALIINVYNDNFDWVKSMRKTMSKELGNKDYTRIVFVGQDGFDNGLLGFINCLRQEPGGEMVRGILIQDPSAPAFSLKNPLYSEQLEKDLSMSVLRKNGVWGTYKHFPLQPCQAKPVYHSFVKLNFRGDLTSLRWIEGPIQQSHDSANIVKIAYSSLNFKDVMLATGKLPLLLDRLGARRNQEIKLGFEYCGINSLGRRVMGLIHGNGIANLCISDPGITWAIPDNWSLEDAATVPCVYATCCYALYLKGNMKKGDKILIHAGAGGVGQAAINLALAEGCEVFTTVGTPEKHQFIRNTFPQIRDDHIGNSRDTSFEFMINDQTNGRGVDIVLNSLSEEKLLASVKCLGWGGRFLEIGKFDLSANNPLGMECFLREVSFHGIMLDHVITAREQEKLEIKLLFYKYLRSGAIKPLVRTVFTKENVEAAFRYMATGKHIGKVLIKIQDEKQSNSMPLSVPHYYCLENRSYLILGGLGGFGLELCDWLVMRGARNLVITSRSGVRNGYQRMRIDLWKGYGVNVIVVSGKDASVYEQCQFIVDTATKLAPIDGIFNLAVVLKDALWENQTSEKFQELFRSKAWATKNLDLITKKVCRDLRHFVVFSSLTSGKGNPGQSNYGMANSVMERICERRVAEGLPGLAVQWGAVGDVGIVADMQEDNKELMTGGTLPQSILSCLNKLNEFLMQNRPVVSSMVVAEKKTTDSLGNILNTVLNIMCFKDLKEINLDSPLSKMGMDSMMGVEIKQTLEREFGVFLSKQDIRNLTFAKLQEMSDAKDSDEKKNNDAETTTMKEMHAGMQMMLQFVLNADFSHETYLKLPTKEETGKGEIFAIPGIEGFATNFAELSPKLSAPLTCLQLGVSNNVYDSIEMMAKHFLTHVVDTCKDKRKFVLIGYSFGSLIAIELARQLEAQGLSGRLFLIDGAPEMIKTIIVKYIKWSNTEEFEDKCLSMILNAVAPQNNLKLIENLHKCKNWDEKVEAFVKLSPTSKTGISLQTQKNCFTSLYKRIFAAITYSTLQQKPIEAPITLLKPTIKSVQVPWEDYGLSKITKNQVEVHYIPGDHVTMLGNDKAAFILNERT